MNGRRILLALAALAAALSSGPARVGSQQNPPCSEVETAGKTIKQMKLEKCGCDQKAATDKPTYRVGAAPSGLKAAPRVGAGRGRVLFEPDHMYNGLHVPDPEDLRSPEVVGMRETVM